MLYTCPCCGFKTFGEQMRGSFEICCICGWEDDNLQFEDPDFAGGANRMSLRHAQQAFIRATLPTEADAIPDRYRGYEKDQTWKPLPGSEPA